MFRLAMLCKVLFQLRERLLFGASENAEFYAVGDLSSLDTFAKSQFVLVEGDVSLQ